MVWTRETSRLVALIVRHPSLRSVSSRIPLSGSSGEESGATDAARLCRRQKFGPVYGYIHSYTSNLSVLLDCLIDFTGIAAGVHIRCGPCHFSFRDIFLRHEEPDAGQLRSPTAGTAQAEKLGRSWKL